MLRVHVELLPARACKQKAEQDAAELDPALPCPAPAVRPFSAGVFCRTVFVVLVHLPVAVRRLIVSKHMGLCSNSLAKSKSALVQRFQRKETWLCLNVRGTTEPPGTTEAAWQHNCGGFWLTCEFGICETKGAAAPGRT